MKRYIGASATFPEYGTGPDSDKRAGVLGFNKSAEYDLGNGWTFDIGTAYLMVDVNTGKIKARINSWVNGPTYEDRIFLQHYTIDEFEEVFATIRKMTAAELTAAAAAQRQSSRRWGDNS